MEISTARPCGGFGSYFPAKPCRQTGAPCYFPPEILNDALMAYQKKKHLRDNILALQTVLRVTQEKRGATRQEIEVFRKYSGFGGLKCILRPCGQEQDINLWPVSERELFEDTRLLYGILRKYAATESEYKTRRDSLRESVLTAFYTPEEVAEAIASAFRGQGITINRMLDPSAGTGVFAGAFRQAAGSITCYEKEPLSAKMLSMLYPPAMVHAAGFESVRMEMLNSYDAVVSNIPFGDHRIYDPLYLNGKDEARKRSCKDIHSYFFLKAADTLRQGGMIAFIAGRGVMDAPGNEYLRRKLMEECRLISAVRLPDNLFSSGAGTQAASDLIILQKDSRKREQTPRESAFTATRLLGGVHINNYYRDFSRVVHTRAVAGKDQYGKPAVNFYYEGDTPSLASLLREMLEEDLCLYPDMWLYNGLLRQQATSGSNETPPAVSLLLLPAPPDGSVPKKTEHLPPPVSAGLYDLFDIPREERGEIARKQQTPAEGPVLRESPAGCFPDGARGEVSAVIRKAGMDPRPYEGVLMDFYKDGTLVRDSGQAGTLSVREQWNTENRCPEKVYTFTPLKATRAGEDCLKAYLHLRDSYFHLHRNETRHHMEYPEGREILNRRYQEFIRAYGDLNSGENRRWIGTDVFGTEILTLEAFENGKKQLADIFYHPVAFSTGDADAALTAEEALACSVNAYGRVDPEYMSGLCGKDREELTEELAGRIYYNPLSGNWELEAQFISGDVIEKSEAVREYIDAHPQATEADESKKSLSALLEAIPSPIPYEELDIALGERWVDATCYENYASDLFRTKVTVAYITDLDNFHISARNEYTAEIRRKYAVKPDYSNEITGLTLFSHALVGTVPRITRPSGRYNASGEEIRIPDTEATGRAQAKIGEICSGFSDYLDKLPRVEKEKLADAYNRRFNARVKPRYEGSFQTFPDLRLGSLGIEKPYRSQYDAVWMLKLLGGGVIDVEVGGGKTLTICIAAHEMKRLGLAYKPMVLGLKSNIFAIADTYRKAYPGDKVLYPTEKDFEPKNRQRLFHKIKNRDWDVVILTHEQFFRIPQSLEIQRDTLQQELDSVEQNLKVCERLTGVSASTGMLKGLEKRRTNLKAALSELYGKMQARRDDVLDFKTMGIDHLFVDESAEFKNLRYDTRYRHVSGLGDPKGSQRALNLLYAIRTMQQRAGRDLCATFLSGTIISNSLVELYLIFKYLRPRAMETQGIRTFDAWAAVYAKKSSDFEFSVTGEIKSKERFRYFKNVPELSFFYMEVCHYRTAGDIGLDRPENNIRLHTTRSTPEQDGFQEKLVEFARTGDGQLVGRPGMMYDSRDSGRMLVVTDLARKAAIDMRLVNSGLYHDHPDNKLSQAAAQIAYYYHKYHPQRASQFVFCDMGTWKREEKGKQGWNLYEELRRKLAEGHGIPAHEIRFIQEAGNIRQRQRLIEDFKQGIVRILVGHTKSLGTGIDAPDRCVATHHIDLPWTPKDLEQRGGRGARKGNLIAKLYADNRVDNIIYASQNSLDTYKFNLLQTKQAFITQLKTNALGSRTFDEGAMDGDGVMNYSEYVAILSGNTDLLDKVRLERMVAALESEQKGYLREQARAGHSLREYREELGRKRSRLEGILHDRETVEKYLPADGNGRRDNPLLLDGFGHNATEEETGRRLVTVSDEADTGGEYLRIGSLLDFGILVRTETVSSETLDLPRRNRFFIEGACKYSYNNGDLSRDPHLAATNFIRALERIPALAANYQSEIATMEKELPVLEEITATPWKKTGELQRLRGELPALERKIQAALDAIAGQQEAEERKTIEAAEEVEVV